MRRTVTFLMLTAVSLFGGERMNVSVCNQGNLPEALIARAEAEAGIVFRAMDVDVIWANCQDELTTPEAGGARRFIVRLRGGHAPKIVAKGLADVMGRAYLSAPGEGHMVDVYYQAVREQAENTGAYPDGLLGDVMAHELGHLLLGPGHSAHGIMHSSLDKHEMMAVRQRALRFTPDQQESIRRCLVARSVVQVASR